MADFPHPGDFCLYRSIAGDIWDAIITAVHPGAVAVDIEVILPGPAGHTLPLRTIYWADPDEIGPARAFPRVTT